MRIITLEEHVSLPEITKLIPPEINNGMEHSPGMERVADALSEVGPKRIKSMDKNKISLQVLSVVGPGADILGENAGPVFAQQYNDAIAEKMKVYPTRFAAFAHLPMTAPTAAAEELQRCVEKLHFKGALINGMTSDEFLDDEKYAPILAKAEALGVPIYLHPGIPPKAVKEYLLQWIAQTIRRNLVNCRMGMAFRNSHSCFTPDHFRNPGQISKTQYYYRSYGRNVADDDGKM